MTEEWEKPFERIDVSLEHMIDAIKKAQAEINAYLERNPVTPKKPIESLYVDFETNDTDTFDQKSKRFGFTRRKIDG